MERPQTNIAPKKNKSSDNFDSELKDKKNLFWAIKQKNKVK